MLTARTRAARRVHLVRRALRVVGVGTDVSVAVGFQGIAALLGFAYQTILLQVLSKSDAGTYFLALAAVVVAAGFSDFGLAATIMPRLAVGVDRALPVFRAAIHLRVASLSLALVLLLCYSVIASGQIPVSVIAAAFVAVVVAAKGTGVRQLYELLWRVRGKTYVVAALALLDMIIGVAGLLVLRSIDCLTLFTAALVFGLCGLPGFALSALPIHRELAARVSWRSRIPSRLYKSVALASLPIGALSFLAQLSAQLETLVLAAVRLGDHQVAAYNAAIRPLTGLIFLATTFSFGLGPLVAQAFKRTRSDISLEFLASAGVRLLGIAGMMIAAIAWIFSSALMSLFGPDYVHEAYILQLFAFVNILIFQVVLADQFLIAIGKRRAPLVGAIIQVTTAVVLEVMIVGSLGVKGMVVAKGVSYIVLHAYQLSQWPKDAYRAAIIGYGRLIPTALALGGSIYATVRMNDVLSIGIVLTATCAAAFAFRSVTLSDLMRLREIRPLS